MKGGRPRSGYTIVEVMIVLAISGALFVMSASFVQGKQASSSFTSGVQEMASRIQDVIEQVSDGQFSDIPISCGISTTTASATTQLRHLTFTSSSAVVGGDTSSATQGTSDKCTFLGQLLHFDTADTTLSNDSYQTYEQFVLAGARTASNDGPLINLNDSALTAITNVPNIGAQPTYAANGAQLTAGTDFTRHEVIPGGLDLAHDSNPVHTIQITYVNSGGTSVTVSNDYTFGFIQGIGTSNTATTSTDSYTTGAQAVQMITDLNIRAGAQPTDVADLYSNPNTAIDQNTVTQAVTKVVLCLTDGSRKGSVTIGDSGGQLEATAQFGSNIAGVCTA